MDRSAAAPVHGEVFRPLVAIVLSSATTAIVEAVVDPYDTLNVCQASTQADAGMISPSVTCGGTTVWVPRMPPPGERTLL